MEFEWHKAKSQSNFEKHGIRFEEAIAIFDGPRLTVTDERDYGEVRELSLGQLGHFIIIAVVHTDRHGITRIISARKANKNERSHYHAYVAGAIGSN